MFENSPAIDLAIGRSSVRQRILALLIEEPPCRLHLREIQRRAGTSPGTASRELARLVAAGLIDREAEGNQVYFRASTSPLATMLRSLLMVMPAPEFGPKPPRLPHPRSPRVLLPVEPRVTNSPADTLSAPSQPLIALGETAAETPAPSPAAVDDAAGAEPDSVAIWPNAAIAAYAAMVADVAVAPDATPPTPTAAKTDESAPALVADPLGLIVAGRLAASLRSTYGDTLRGVYLYGARASGSAPADADVETIVVLDRVDNYGAELERTSHFCAELSHECNLIVSRIFVSASVWDGGLTGRMPAVRAEAVAL